MITLDFLNKNMYRKYPFQDTCTLVSSDGSVLPQGLITSIQLSTKYNTHELYVSKIVVTQKYVSITVNNAADDAPIGCFAGRVLKDFEILPFKVFSNYSYVSGNATLGKKEILNSCLGIYTFETPLLIEDSCIFCFTPPLVSGITHDSKRLTGRITTSVSTDLRQSFPTDLELSLEVVNTAGILSNNEFSGDLETCNTPLIKKINTVQPNSSGNIDIYGILPISINISTGQLVFDNPLDLIDVCPEKNKISPPVNNSNDYYTDMLETDTVEWRTWPRFS